MLNASHSHQTSLPLEKQHEIYLIVRLEITYLGLYQFSTFHLARITRAFIADFTAFDQNSFCSLQFYNTLLAANLSILLCFSWEGAVVKNEGRIWSNGKEKSRFSTLGFCKWSLNALVKTGVKSLTFLRAPFPVVTSCVPVLEQHIYYLCALEITRQLFVYMTSYSIKQKFYFVHSFIQSQFHPQINI